MTAESSTNRPAKRRRIIAVAVLPAAAVAAAIAVAMSLDDDGKAAQQPPQRVAVEAQPESVAAPTDATTGDDPTSDPSPEVTPADTVGPTSPTLTVTTMRHDELTFSWTPSVDLPIPGGVGVAGYQVIVDGKVAGLFDAEQSEAVVMTSIRADGEPHFIQVIPIDLNGTPGVPGWATVRRGPELGAPGH